MTKTSFDFTNWWHKKYYIAIQVKTFHNSFLAWNWEIILWTCEVNVAWTQEYLQIKSQLNPSIYYKYCNCIVNTT